MKKRILSILCCAYLATSFQAEAQFIFRKDKSIRVGVMAGVANYYGDLAPARSFVSTYPQLTRPALGVTASKAITPKINVRAGLTWARIKGSDAVGNASQDFSDPKKLRNLSFRNDVKELSVTGEFRPLNRGIQLKNKTVLHPYIFAGLAVFHHNPKAYYNGGLMQEGWYTLQPLRTEGQQDGYGRVQMSLPFGWGLRYAYSKEIEIGFEMGWRKTFTDYLDDVSTRYADKGLLMEQSGREAWILSDRSIELKQDNSTYVGADGNPYPYYAGISSNGAVRGNSNNKDWYIVTGLQVSYKLQYNRNIPKFR
ncbi:MAG: DUF6089 family protein [Hymenobacteraceae bacterium]|nr:DUF6089 family protein [Hymenobacteraceae bacterium]MDX5396731.1 DUF6089 family protein [Hymenobacteraceae bacterium]MDX5444391.1 DUF6089 family protein [Hymenobacteraceae bacterium]MDX5512791.1 DUF6089 family protein [Hymenobacteraceae bacterium]